MQDPQSLHKYLYVHGDPISGVDPTGRFSMSISGLSVSINVAGFTASFHVGAYLGTVATSYIIGKAISAAFLYHRDGNLDELEWFETWDLLNFVPGAIWLRFARLPLRVVALAPGKGFVGKLFAREGHKLIAQKFAQLFPQFWKRVLPNGTELYLKSGAQGFRHLITRHLPQYFEGGSEAVIRGTTFWPTGTTSSQVLSYLDETIRVLGNGVNIGALTRARLSNNLVVEIFVAPDGRIASLYPVSGPGVVKAINVLKELI